MLTERCEQKHGKEIKTFWEGAEDRWARRWKEAQGRMRSSKKCKTLLKDSWNGLLHAKIVAATFSHSPAVYAQFIVKILSVYWSFKLISIFVLISAILCPRTYLAFFSCRMLQDVPSIVISHRMHINFLLTYSNLKSLSSGWFRLVIILCCTIKVWHEHGRRRCFNLNLFWRPVPGGSIFWKHHEVTIPPTHKVFLYQ